MFAFVFAFVFSCLFAVVFSFVFLRFFVVFVCFGVFFFRLFVLCFYVFLRFRTLLSVVVRFCKKVSTFFVRFRTFCVLVPAVKLFNDHWKKGTEWAHMSPLGHMGPKGPIWARVAMGP